MLALQRVAAAGRDGPLVRRFEVEVGKSGVGVGLDVVGDVLDVQIARVERHEIMHVAAFGEVVQTEGIVQAIVDRLAVELELLRDLVLLLAIGDLLHRLGDTVQVGADVPGDLAPAGDRP